MKHLSVPITLIDIRKDVFKDILAGNNDERHRAQ